MANIAGIMELYTAYFNRVADKDGVDYWANEVDTNGWSLDDVAASFAEQTEYTTIYAGLTNAEIISKVYNNVLGRDADAEGAAYWEADLTAGNITVDKLIVAVVNAANENGGDDAAALAASTEKSQAAYDLGSNATDISLAGTLEEVTTAAQAAVDAAEQAAQDAADQAAQDDAAVETVGSTIVFTDKIDALVGTAGNDTFVGSAAELVNADQVAGGQGTDTAKLYGVAAQADIPVMDSVENLILIDSTVGVDVSETGATTVTVENGTSGQDWTVAASQTVTASKTINAENIGLDFGASATEASVIVDAFGTNAAATGSATLDIIGALIKTVNIEATGKASDVVLDNAAVDGFTTLNISGSVKTDIDATNETAITTVNSTNTGGLTIDVGASTKNTTITTVEGNDSITATAAVNYTINTGAGDDKIILDDATNNGSVTALDTIDAGEGTDTLSMYSANIAAIDDNVAADAAIRAKLVGFEKIEIGDDFDTALDLKYFGINDVILKDVSTGSTLSNLTSGATITIEDAQDFGAADATSAGLGAVAAKVIVSMTNATAAGTADDTLNIVLNSDLANQANANAAVDTDFQIDGINHITVTANDKDNADLATGKNDGYGISFDNGQSLETLTITGTSEVSFLGTNEDNALKTVDASALEAEAIINLDAVAGTQGVTVTGTANDDTITGSLNADVINGGAGDDSITGKEGNDTLNGGEGSNTFVFETTAALNGKDTISDFNVGALAGGGDVLNLSALTDITSTDIDTAITSTTSAATLVSGDIFTVTWSGNIADKDFGGAEFTEFFGAGKVFSTTVTASDEAVVIVQGDDVTKVYMIDEDLDGTGNTTLAVDGVSLIATLTGITNADTIDNVNIA